MGHLCFLLSPQELISLIKNTKIPVICMCNDRNSQKIRSLANYCFDLRFQRPRVEQIKVHQFSPCAGSPFLSASCQSLIPPSPSLSPSSSLLPLFFPLPLSNLFFVLPSLPFSSLHVTCFPLYFPLSFTLFLFPCVSPSFISSQSFGPSTVPSLYLLLFLGLFTTYVYSWRKNETDYCHYTFTSYVSHHTQLDSTLIVFHLRVL